MNKKKKQDIFQWFATYVRSFDTNDFLIQTNLKYKEDHSYEVSKLCGIIAESLQLSEEEIQMAEVIGLLHDTGRFSQFTTYKTYNDAISVNHALLGAKELQEKNALPSLEPEEQRIVLQSIQNHNLFILPPEQEKPILLFSKIIRDADKIDIYRFMLDSESKRLNGEIEKAIHLGLEGSHHFSNKMISDILNNRCCLYRDLVSTDDFKLLQLSWIFDINFDFSFTLLKEKNYIVKISSLLPKSISTQSICQHLHAFMESKINSQTSQKISAG